MTAHGKPGSLSRTTAMGVAWLIVQALGSRGVGLLAQIVLARLLQPADFGILGLALTVTSVVGVITTFGVDDVLLQRQRSLRYWTRPAFHTAVALGTAAFLGICAFTPAAAAIYHSPTLGKVLPVMALAMPIGALGMVPTVKLRASMRFKTLAQVNLAEQTCIQGLTILFAWLGYGALSFALPLPITAALRSIVLWLIARPAFRPTRRGQHGYMLRQGGTVLASRLITAGVSQGAYVLLGVLTNSSVVGIYFFAYRLAVQPVQVLAGNFQAVLFPALAQLQGDLARQRDAALNASRILAGAVMPYCFLQAALADPVIRLLFSQKWLASIPLVQILSIGLAFDAVSWLAGSLLSARGEFARALKYSLFFLPVFFAAIAVGALAGESIGVALGVSLFYSMMGPVYSHLVFRRYGSRKRELAAIYFLPALAAAGCMGAAMLAAHALGYADRPIPRILVTGTLGPLLYLASLKLTVPALFAQLAERIRAFTDRVSPPPPLLQEFEGR